MTMIKNNNSSNPLLFDNNANDLVKFSTIKPEHFQPALSVVIKRVKELLSRTLSNDIAACKWQDIENIESVLSQLNEVFSIMSHLNSVVNSRYRTAYQACLPDITKFHSELLQNKELRNLYQHVRDNCVLSEEQRTVVSNALRDFRLSGSELSDQDQSTFKALVHDLTMLQNEFANNVLTDSSSWSYHVKPQDEHILSSMPGDVVSVAKAKAAEQGSSSGWVFSLDAVNYGAIMKYCKSSEVRKVFYTAYNTRASNHWVLIQKDEDYSRDNSIIIEKILHKRRELAQLLGYTNYSYYSLETKMASDPDEVLEFLYKLHKLSYDKALDNLNEVKEFAAKHEDQNEELAIWDVEYYRNLLEEDVIGLREEDLRPYFQLHNVLNHMFEVAKQLYGISIREEEAEFDKWQDDVRLFNLFDSDGKICGRFYLDLYTRDDKNQGAWMSGSRSRSAYNRNLKLPIAFFITNFMKPVQGESSLLTHDEVVTLFHEFGHTLHHLLTKCSYDSVSGTNGVAWDAVELPSQLMESWAWEWAVLSKMTQNADDPDNYMSMEMFELLQKKRKFHKASFLNRQLTFALYDFIAHNQSADSSISERDIMDNVRQDISIYETPNWNKFQNTFLHIYSGGYAAGYYSYLWADVLSADAFAAFKENGVLNKEIGAQFKKCVLEMGGVRPAGELFREFRSREPQIEHLLKKYDLS